MIRKSNFELMRIIAILMIIGLHYFNAYMGGALKYTVGANYKISILFESLCIIGVNLFILVTGYFNVNKKSVYVGKLLNLALLAYFYGTVFYILEIVFKYQHFNLIEFIKTINPFLHGKYWFVKYYIILNLLIPFINILLERLDKKLTFNLICILLLLFSIWPSFLIQPPIADGGYGLMNFILLYIIGATIKIYGSPRFSKKCYFTTYIICGLITFLFASLGIGRSWNYNFIFNILGSTALFIMFSKLDIESKSINYLSSFTFSIYLIHFSKFMIRFLYHDVLKCENFYDSPWFIAHFLLSVFIIYTFSILLDSIRRAGLHLVKWGYKKMLKNKYLSLLEERVNKSLVLDFSPKSSSIEGSF